MAIDDEGGNLKLRPRRGLSSVRLVEGTAASDRSELGGRCVLLISIETPVDDVDIWTPVAVEVGLPVTIET